MEEQDDASAQGDSIQDAVLRVLESNENGIITNTSLKDAVLTVVRERRLQANGSDIQSLVDKIQLTASNMSNGKISRALVRRGFEAHAVDVSKIFDE